MHPSLLPKYRGGAPIFHAVANGDPESGISYVEISKKVFDAGNIIHQVRAPISTTDLYDEVESELINLNNDQINYINKFKAATIQNINQEDEDNENSIHPLNCNYYSLNEFTEAKFDPNRSFSVLHLNAHSIELHIEEINAPPP